MCSLYLSRDNIVQMFFRSSNSTRALIDLKLQKNGSKINDDNIYYVFTWDIRSVRINRWGNNRYREIFRLNIVTVVVKYLVGKCLFLTVWYVSRTRTANVTVTDFPTGSPILKSVRVIV